MSRVKAEDYLGMICSFLNFEKTTFYNTPTRLRCCLIIINVLIPAFNGLQVNGGGGIFDREFTKSLIIRDFDDVLKNPFRYVDLFLLHTLSSKKIPKIAMQDL